MARAGIPCVIKSLHTEPLRVAHGALYLYSTSRPTPMRRRMLMCLAVLVVAGSCTNPRVQANIAEALNDVGTELTAQRQDMALLQDQLDSLKHVAAHQDSVIKRLINITNLPPGAAQDHED